MVKVCTSCKLEKPLDAFAKASKANGSLFGVRSACKECTNKRYHDQWHSDPEFRAKEIARSVVVRRNDVAANPGKYRNRRARPTVRCRILAQNRAWYARNRDQQRKRILQWSKINRSRAHALAVKRIAAKKSSTPKWLTAIHKAQIVEMYDIAECLNIQTGIKHHVDHVVPLRGRGVRGLHVPWNLQVLTAERNFAKHNRIPSELTHLFWTYS